MLALGVVANTPLPECLDRGAGELVHAAPPLRGDQRLDPGVAALARADGVPVALALLELVVLLQPGDDALVRLLLIEPLEALRGEAAVRPDHR